MNYIFSISWFACLICLALEAESKTIPKTPITNGYIQNGSTLAEKIQHSTYSDVTAIFQQCKEQGVSRVILREAISLAYAGNLNNFDKVVKFINNISCPATKYIGLASLFDELESNDDKRTNEMMTLIYWIKMAMSEPDLDHELQTSYEDLKVKLPSDMRAILFGQNLRLKNVQENEYMYESSKGVNGHRIILTWRPGGPVAQSAFYFVPYMEGNKPYYIIRNDIYDQGSPMCLSSSNFNSERRKTVTCPNEPISPSMKWFVEPRAGTTYFTITNWDETQLYSPNNQNLYDKERRYVFTWLGSGTLGTQRYWIVEEI